MKNLLDSDLITGPHEVGVGLRPHRLARCVSDLYEAEAAVVHLCQVWGGSANPIVPVYDGAAAQYLELALVSAEIDGYSVPEGTEAAIPYLEKEPEWDYSAAVIVAHERAEGARPVEIVDLDRDDPWRLSYLATLGQMPQMLDEGLCQSSGLNGLNVNEVITTSQVTATGSLEDLLDRLTNFEKLTPRKFSTLYLATGSDPNTGYSATERLIPTPWEHATAAGPNLVVVMSPGSVDDLALLWNLRAQWGDSRALPIGVPVDLLDATAIRRLHQPGVTTFFGLSGGHLYLTSETVPPERLQEIAASVHGVEVASPAALFRLGHAPSRTRTHVQVWTDGEARLPTWTDADREVLAATAHRPPSLKLSVAVPDAPIPTVGPLRGRYSSDYQCGAAQVQASKLSGNTVRVHWPSSWTSLAAASLRRGLDVRESQPGLAAMNLIRALGSTWEIRYLCDARLVELLYELAERSGMSWWKERWNRVEERLRVEGKSEKEIEALALEMERDEPVVAAAGESRQLAYSRFQACFGRRDVTDRWLEWAIERRLVVKGIEIKCPACRVTFWLPVQEMSASYTCSGCSRAIAHPFRSDQVLFKYRIGEVLRQCLEVDALGHVLALRWLTELFERHGLVGAHPGAEFLRGSKVVGEADVLLLFADGSMVPCEVKRRATAFGAEAAAQLEGLSNELAADFDVMCVMDSIDRCGDVVPLKRLLPERPRFLLTIDHLSAQFVVWSMGGNPFELGHREQEAVEKQREAWLNELAAIGSIPNDWAESTVDSWRRKAAEGGAASNGETV